jgi:ABC-type glycerol-3-phosphate transport system substrate-binding protein
MPLKALISRVLLVVCLFALSGCDTPPQLQANFTEIPATPTSQLNLTPTVPVSPVEAQLQTLVVWIPEDLLPVDNEAAAALLEAQVRDFEAQYENVRVEIRRKRVREAGGIISTLRAASAVAPGALPDLTLLEHNDLLNAARNNLIQPLEGWIPSSIISGLHENALRQGFFDDQLYGLAYTLDVLLVAYRPEVDAPSRWTFDNFLDSRLSFVFPAGSASGVNPVFLLQYFSAGGTLPVDGVVTLNENALLETLRFYEQAVAEEAVEPQVLNYMTFDDYRSAFVEGAVDAGVVDVTGFSELRQDMEVRSGAIPSAEGTSTTFLTGWMWCLVSTDTERQTLAAQFMSWMMDANRQGEYAQALGMLTSQPEAQRRHPIPGIDNRLIDELLDNAVIPLEQSASPVVMRAMQNALIAVLNGEMSAEEATRQAVQQLSG